MSLLQSTKPVKVDDPGECEKNNSRWSNQMEMEEIGVKNNHVKSTLQPLQGTQGVSKCLVVKVSPIQWRKRVVEAKLHHSKAGHLCLTETTWAERSRSRPNTKIMEIAGHILCHILTYLSGVKLVYDKY